MRSALSRYPADYKPVDLSALGRVRQWEYAVVDYEDRILADLGKKGWELIQVDFHRGFAVFKRPLVEDGT